MFGYDTGVISGALLYIKTDLGASDFEQQAVIGALLIGAVLSGWTTDRIGRKWTKVGSGTIYVIGALGSAFAPGIESLIAARLVLGLAVGDSVVRVAPVHLRARPALDPGRGHQL